MKIIINTVKSAIFFLAISLSHTACENTEESGSAGESEVPFAAEMASTTVRAGEPVTFNLSGNPHIITFWSGEEFNEYAHRNEDRVVSAGDITVTFQHKYSNSLQSTVPYQICKFASKFVYSTDFSGKLKEGSTTEYDIEAVEAATWNDLSDQLTYTYRMNQFYDAGAIDFTDIFGDGKKVYIGLRYFIVPNNTWDRPEDPALDEALGDANPRSKYPKYPIRRMEYLVQNFAITAIPTGGSANTVVDMANMGWKRCKTGDYWSVDTGDRPTLTPSLITFTHSNINPTGYCEAWVISKPIVIENTINYGADTGKDIKNYKDKPLTSYEFTYNTPGKYTITFVAKTLTSKGAKEVVREMEVTVLEPVQEPEQEQPE